MAMKNFLLLLFASLLLISCEDLETNTPAMQGSIDYEGFFRANDARAEKNDDGSYTLQGYSQNETLTLHINNAQLGTYLLGEGRPNYASFEYADGDLYTTSPNGEGEITLTDRCLSCGWLTGIFHFSAIKQDSDTIVIHQGVFHKVSFLEGGLIGDGGQISAGEFTAKVNGDFFEAITVSADVLGGTLIIDGAIGTRKITIEVPANVSSGNYNLPMVGFRAAYTNDDGTEEAISGVITVNFNNTETNRILIFFYFETDNHVIGEGLADIDY